MRFVIVAATIGATGPSGCPVIASRCCVNWLVAAPSIVQCPVLCTRGAISLATSSPLDLEELEREHPDVVE